MPPSVRRFHPWYFSVWHKFQITRRYRVVSRCCRRHHIFSVVSSERFFFLFKIVFVVCGACSSVLSLLYLHVSFSSQAQRDNNILFINMYRSNLNFSFGGADVGSTPVATASVALASLLTAQLFTSADPIGKCYVFWKQLLAHVRYNEKKKRQERQIFSSAQIAFVLIIVNIIIILSF